MSEKVYCFDCKHLKSENRFKETALHNCRHPENVSVKSSWLYAKTKYQVSPKKINKNNDCKWFEEFIEHIEGEETL